MLHSTVGLAMVGILAAVQLVGAVQPTSCGERMEGVFSSAGGGGHAVQLRVAITYPGFVMDGRFRCDHSPSRPCLIRKASVRGLFRVDGVTTRYRVLLSRGAGDAYQLLCDLDGTAPFLFGLYLPALEGTYVCDDGRGGHDEGTFQLVGVGKGRCR